jgi:mannose-6-phosphate isomerase-like protein (cupin superfamily)
MRASTPGLAPSRPTGWAMAEIRNIPAELARLNPEVRDFAEVLHSPSGSLSLTVLRRPAGWPDDQQPHTEDEVYYIIAGRGAITIAEERVPIEPGSAVFVGAGVEHHFVDVTEDLEVLVFWSPARHSNRPG